MIFDADNHYYEPEDCFTRFMPQAHLDDAIRVVETGGGRQTYIGDRPFTFLREPFSPNHVKPGALREMLRTLKSGIPPEQNPAIEPIQPAYRDRQARLALMDEQGLDAMVLFPTVAVCVEHFMKDRPERTYRNVHAFNEWMLDDWGFGSDGRIYGVPLMSLLDVDSAIAELRWVMERGARFIHLRPGPQGGRNPADPIFDPFWSIVNEAGLTVCFHISESGYNEMFSVQWGEDPNPPSHEQSAFQWTSFYGDLPIMHTIAGLIFMNFFGRFPRIRIMSVENGSLWVPYLMAAMDKMKGMGRNGPWRGGYVAGKPSEIIREKVFVSPYHEEDVAALVRQIGVSQVLFGSDFPHAEGLASPLEFTESLQGMSDHDRSLIMGENMAALAVAPVITLATHGLIAPTTPPRAIGGPGTAGGVVEALVRDRGDEVVLIGRHGRLTGHQVAQSVDRAAAALASLGVQAGTRVAASLPNDVDVVIAFFATMRLGGIWLGINRPLAPPEKAYMLGDAEVAVFLCDRPIAESLEPRRGDLPYLRHVLVVDHDAPTDAWRDLCAAADPTALPPEQRDPLAPAAIAYTSGTTGFPKGAVHTQHNLLLPGLVRATTTGSTGGVLGVPLPLTILNLIVLGPLVAWQTGATLVAMDRVDGLGMAEWIRDAQVTTFSAVPAMVHDLLTHPEVTDEHLASIQAIGVGGADMPDAFRRLYEERFGTRVGTGYGLTEAPTAVTIEDVSQPAVAGSCGRALPQVTIHILDDDDRPVPLGEVGEVCVGPATEGPFADVYRPMLGYWNRPEASAAALRNGLLHTGDLGVMDADGNLWIKDRRNDLILRGGANVYPAEVERVLHDDPAVAACAVIGVPDDRLGERVVAFVELASGRTTTTEALQERCRQELARYKVPDTITFVAAFDRTPMGKIRKDPLRALASSAP